MSEQAPVSNKSETLNENNPSLEEVLGDFLSKRSELEDAVVEAESRQGFKLDATEMMTKRRDEKAARESLDAFMSGWNEMGGNRLDEAQARVDNLNFKDDTNTRLEAKSELKRAQNAFYENFIANQAEASEQPVSKSAGFDPDKEIAAAQARIEADIEAKVEAYTQRNEDDPQTVADRKVLSGEQAAEDMSDIMKIDKSGMAHVPAGSGSRSGNFISKQNREQLEASADLIRESADEYAALREANDQAVAEEFSDETAAATEGESLEDYERRHSVPEDQRTQLEELPTDELDRIARGEGGEGEVQPTLPGLEELPTDELDQLAADDPEADGQNESQRGGFRKLFGTLKDKLWDTPGRWVGTQLSMAKMLKRREGETDDSYNERKEKRGKVVMAVAGVAIAAAASYKLLNGLDDGSEMATVGGDFYHPGYSDDPDALKVTEFTSNEVNEGGVGNGESGAETGADTDSATGETAEEDPLESIVEGFSKEARTVTHGEGGWNTLREMGVGESDYEEIWEQVGAELKKTGQGDLVYRMDDGRWGWNIPGQLDDTALKTAAEVLQRNNIDVTLAA